MKKQFYRVKQLADQRIFKADKSDTLNHKELQTADHKVEYLRSALTNISKRLPASQGSEGNVDKRMKKYPEYLLGQVLQEQGHRPVESECELLQYILRECANIELELAKEQADHESKVEQMVSTPLQDIVDKDLPNITKHKRNLNKYILDKDSASNRYNSSKNGNKDALKDDMEEADIKVEQHRDALATEMFNLLRKESDMSQYMLQLLKLQRAYHESALKNLEKVIPTLEQRIGDSSVKAVFGLNLEEHLRVTNRKIAFPLEICVCALTELGMHEEGLFRVVGGASRVKRLKLSIDSGCFSFPLLQEYLDVHVLASTLKSYLRELPEPLLTYNLYNEWMEVMRHPEEQRVRMVQEVLRKLPQANRTNLTYLVQFFAKLSKNPENKMTSSNIAIVISPNLLWSPNKEMDMHMVNCSTLNMIVELFINHADALFPDNVGAYLKISAMELLAAEESEFIRPNLSHLKLISHDVNNDYVSSGGVAAFHAHHYPSDISQSDTSSPKPQTRRKAKAAPNPPGVTILNRNDVEFGSNDRVNVPPSYPSGSTTLNRSHKPKTAVQEAKSKITNTEDGSSSPRRQSLILVDAPPPNVIQAAPTAELPEKPNETPKADLVSDTRTAEVTYVSQPAVAVQQTQARPIQQIVAQTVTVDNLIITSNNIHVKPNTNNNQQQHQALDKQQQPIRPVAAPRTLVTDNQKPPIDNAKSSGAPPKTENTMSKSLSSMMEVDGEIVQVRRPSNDSLNERPTKPMVPVRPASLKAVPRNAAVEDPNLQKQQCSVYSVAHKQQPSYVNIPSNRNSGDKFPSGHDVQMAEKERFLGHQTAEKVLPRPSLENKCGDVNFNYSESMRGRTSSVGSNSRPNLPPKATGLMKSTEKLDGGDESPEKMNGNNPKPSHMRTQSDGNIVDVVVSPVTSFLQTPPSPRSLNKPTQPPPPPPVNVNRPKSDADSTDL